MSTEIGMTLSSLLTPDQKESLEAIYLSKEVATDQLRRAPSVLAEIVDAFHAATGRTDIDPGLLLRYIFNRRKLKDWPRLGKRAHRFVSVVGELTERQTAALRIVYESLDETSDKLLFSTALIRRIASMFRESTGTAVAGSLLVAVIVAKRKRGEWVRIRSGERSFGDIAEVVRKHRTG